MFRIAIIAAMLVAVPANAMQYILKFQGTVNSLYSSRNFTKIDDLPTSLNIGDRADIQYRLEVSSVPPTAYYDSDKSINIYYTTVSRLSIRIGNYRAKIDDTSPFSSIQIWDNYVSGGKPVDLFFIGVLDQKTSSPVAFDVGTGNINEQVHFNAIDFSSLARTSDLLEDVAPFSAYGSWGGFYSSMNSNDNTIAIAQLNYTKASISAVPEPQSWLIMTFGFAVIGAVVRRRRQSATI
jgi:hypothetical protein